MPKKDPRKQGQMPPKIDGEHRWVIMAVYSITAHQAQAMEDGAIINIGERVDSTVGCYDCSEHFLAAKGTPCTAGAK